MHTVVKDFAVNSYSLDFLSKKHNLPKSKIIKMVRAYADKTKSLRVSYLLKDKIAKYIIKDFMNYMRSAPEFAKEYGMTQKAFTEFILTSVNDTLLIPSDNVANSVYCRFVSRGVKVPVNLVPARIITYIASTYVADRNLSQVELAAYYNVEGKSIAKMLKRGIAEDIVSDDIAECIYHKINKHVFPSKESLSSLDQAFEQREVTKVKKEISQLEAIMESDDDNVNYLSVQSALDKLRTRLALYEAKT